MGDLLGDPRYGMSRRGSSSQIGPFCPALDYALHFPAGGTCLPVRCDVRPGAEGDDAMRVKVEFHLHGRLAALAVAGALVAGCVVATASAVTVAGHSLNVGRAAVPRPASSAPALPSATSAPAGSSDGESGATGAPTAAATSAVPNDGAQGEPNDVVDGMVVSVGADGFAMVSTEGGASMQVTVSASTAFAGVSRLSDLRAGMAVTVEGVLQPDGTLRATSVTAEVAAA